MIPYENQLIGAFLYAAGYAGGLSARSDNPSAPMPVNLLQQTLLDRSFSDLVVGHQRCFVLEFKRSLKELAEEKAKWNSGQLAQFGGDKILKSQSKRGHLVIYGRPGPGTIELRVCFYLDILGLTTEPHLDRMSAQRLIEKLHGLASAEKVDYGLPPAQLLAYLEVMRTLRRKQGSAGGRSPKESAWIGVAVDEDGFSYRSADSLDELFGLDLALEQEQEPDHEPSSPGMER